LLAVVRGRDGADDSPRRRPSTFVLNPAQKGKGRLHEESALTTVAGARYAQRCPVKDPTEVGQKVQMSRNGVNRRTDEPVPRYGVSNADELSGGNAREARETSNSLHAALR